MIGHIWKRGTEWPNLFWSAVKKLLVIHRRKKSTEIAQTLSSAVTLTLTVTKM